MLEEVINLRRIACGDDFCVGLTLDGTAIQASNQPFDLAASLPPQTTKAKTAAAGREVWGGGIAFGSQTTPNNHLASEIKAVAVGGTAQNGRVAFVDALGNPWCDPACTFAPVVAGRTVDVAVASPPDDSPPTTPRAFARTADGNVWPIDSESPLPTLGPVSAMAAGDRHLLVLYGNGTVDAFDISQDAPISAGAPFVPANLSNVIAITVKRRNNVALKSDGTVVAWDTDGTIVPDQPWLRNVVAVAAAANGIAVLRPSIPLTIASSPPGLSFSTSGPGCPSGAYAPETSIALQLTPGTDCTVTFDSIQPSPPGAQYIFNGWADGPPSNSRTFSITTAASYVGNFRAQYLLDTVVSPNSTAGTVSGGGYYDVGAVATVGVAETNPDYRFKGFSGALSGSANPQAITMDAPKTVTAIFSRKSTLQVQPAAGQYSDAVTLGAALGPSDMVGTGTLQFSVAGTPVGTPEQVVEPGNFTASYLITQERGDYAVAAVFTSTVDTIESSHGSGALTVSPEQATVTPSAGNPTAVTVDATGTAGPIVLQATIHEEPDGSPGDIGKAIPVTVALVSQTGGSIGCAVTTSGGGVGGALAAEATCGNVPPNAYTVRFDVGGMYYIGSNHSTTLTVNALSAGNHPPVITSVTGPVNPIALNGNAPAVTVQFTDADAGDTHTCALNWGDGPPVSGTVNESQGTCAGAHTYAQPGVYTVTATVTDSHDARDTRTFEYIVIYDASAGFVTGGGWINSPAGAYVADPSLTGKATFGFVAKYNKGATVPSGQTEFQFHVASFNFKSASYDWLVVSGAKAQFKGSGTVNGAGNYMFLLTATDGNISGGGGVDKFRIKITDKSTGALVYDNVANASDDINAANPQAIGGGSIVIHKP
ncbi:MAG: PKD domain-containing protein [Bryobacteraceae bacterium]|nr:PKD domain-containing protein [Bryobacteraceae bacterium]